MPWRGDVDPHLVFPEASFRFPLALNPLTGNGRGGRARSDFLFSCPWSDAATADPSCSQFWLDRVLGTNQRFRVFSGDWSSGAPGPYDIEGISFLSPIPETPQNKHWADQETDAFFFNPELYPRDVYDRVK